MTVNNTTQNTDSASQINNTTNQKNKSNQKFDDILNINIQEKLPSDAFEKQRQTYRDEMTDEKFESVLKDLGIDNLSNEEKEFYKSIVDDRLITRDEIKDLSYEQIETLNKFRATTQNTNTDDINDFFVSCYVDVSNILNIPLVSNDEDFNKAIYESMKDMDDTREFMVLVTGSHNFPHEAPIDYNTTSPYDVLTAQIQIYEEKLENTTRVEDNPYYKRVIGIYSDILQTYDEIREKNVTRETTNDDEIVDVKADLFADLISLLKTGLTVSEVEYIEKLTSNINNLIEESKTKDISKDKLEDMIKELKEKIAEIQKRFGEKDGEKTTKESLGDESEGLSLTMKEFKSIVSTLEKTFADLKEKSNRPDAISTQDELKLREEYRNFKG